MMQVKREIRVAAGVVWKDGRLLCCRRPDGSPMGGWWEFPGGKLEPGETPEAALSRELKEELGLMVIKCQPWQSLTHDYEEQGLRVHLHFFHVTEFEGEPVPLEGQEFVWADPDEAKSLAFLPADAGIVRKLAQPAL